MKIVFSLFTLSLWWLFFQPIIGEGIGAGIIGSLAILSTIFSIAIWVDNRNNENKRNGEIEMKITQLVIKHHGDKTFFSLKVEQGNGWVAIDLTPEAARSTLNHLPFEIELMTPFQTVYRALPSSYKSVMQQYGEMMSNSMVECDCQQADCSDCQEQNVIHEIGPRPCPASISLNPKDCTCGDSHHGIG